MRRRMQEQMWAKCASGRIVNILLYCPITLLDNDDKI